MKRIFFVMSFAAMVSLVSLGAFTGCKGNKGAGKHLQVEEVDPNSTDNGSQNTDNTSNDAAWGGGQTLPKTSVNGLHPMFSAQLGVPIVSDAFGTVDPDPTGLTACDDYDGDGIPNDQEISSNPFVADYPRIVTRISPPITMEIRVSETDVTKNHSETVEDTNVKDTISNMAEGKHYTQMNKKTTPYVTKESESTSNSTSSSSGYSVNGSVSAGGFGYSASASFGYSKNQSMANSFAESSMAETTVFKDVDYADNLDRNGVEYTNQTVSNMTKNYRKSSVSDSTFECGPNAGIVRAALFLKNLTVNMPAKITDVVCTLSFRTPAGEFLPIKTFKLRNEDWSEFEEEIYGDEELGPYTVEVTGLGTNEVRKALANGYVAQIHVVSYKLSRVPGSNYNPGVDNLKIVEETAKGRTATINIIGSSMRELYRVAAFDINADGSISPGISLKKALFNILRDRIGKGETWDSAATVIDRNGKRLTVTDKRLIWKNSAVDKTEYVFTEGVTGNNWRLFETYIKTWVDEYNNTHKLETIKRIGPLEKYNPFSIEDNPEYNPNEALTLEKILNMKYWIIYHNGRYFNGDINDPIWAGERYEIVCYDMRDFNQHFTGFNYTPLQSMESFELNTLWNRLTNTGDFARSKYLGRLIKGDVVHLEVDLLQSKFLFDPALSPDPVGSPQNMTDGTTTFASLWNQFNYTFYSEQSVQAMPGNFHHSAQGGTNNITVSIEESTNALSYDISVTEKSSGTVRTVNVLKEDLVKSNWSYIINSRVKDSLGNDFILSGYTPATSTTAEKLYADYLVNVTARGKCYGYDVTANSLSNSQTTATVEDAVNAPGAFSFGISGAWNKLIVNVGKAGSALSNGAEYYHIRYSGPLNVNYPPTVVKDETIIGRNGENIIDIATPSVAVREPGVYLVQVTAANSIGNNSAPQSGTLFTMVYYDYYADQKLNQPSVSSAYFDLKAMDMEVNFNDGSGWYRLKFTNEGTGEKEIDCRYSSYYEQNKQKFHLYFMAPAGADATYPSSYDVFTGARDEVDLYIRTVPRPRYRDTFWLKQNAYSGAGAIITPVDLGLKSILNYWIESDYTDATNIETTVSNFHYNDETVIPAGSFRLRDSGTVTDYFFAPLEQRKYNVKASIAESLVIKAITTVDKPEFKVSKGDHSLLVYDILNSFGDSYEVFWKEGSTVLPNEDIRQGQWYWSGRISASSSGTGFPEYTIENLKANVDYVIGVKAYNRYAESQTTFYGDINDNPLTSQIEVTTVQPYTTDKAPAPAGVIIALGSDNASIDVSNLAVPGEYQYVINWKKTSEAWPQDNQAGAVHDTYNKNWPLYNYALVQGEVSTSVSYKITQQTGTDTNGNVIAIPLSGWEQYHVRVCALSKNGDLGDYIDPVVTVNIPAAFGATAEWFELSNTQGRLRIALSLPPGTQSYKYEGKIYHKEGPAGQLYDGPINYFKSDYRLGWVVTISNGGTLNYFLNSAGSSHAVLIGESPSLTNGNVFFTGSGSVDRNMIINGYYVLTSGPSYISYDNQKNILTFCIARYYSTASSSSCTVIDGSYSAGYNITLGTNCAGETNTGIFFPIKSVGTNVFYYFTQGFVRLNITAKKAAVDVAGEETSSGEFDVAIPVPYAP